MENISDLLGKIIVSVEQTEDTLTFTTDDKSVYKLYHEQDCCEYVCIESIAGDLNDLLNTPILLAEEVNSEEPTDPNPNVVGYQDESYTWTFYKLATMKGYVDIRFYGSSNGYYSESVTFAKIA